MTESLKMTESSETQGDLANSQHLTLDDLAPQKLWWWFSKICSIPHGSHNEEKLANYIIHWAKNNNITTTQDKVGNIFLQKNATDGMSDRQSIALQAHLDMVIESNMPFDFQNSPITPIIEGDWVKAQGTTLGADNGLGLASILALFDSDDIAHPKLEAVLTMTEEVGMDGAKGLDGTILQSTLMINTDTEEIGEIYVGCAGGVDADMMGKFAIVAVNDNHLAYTVGISGLKGGHSGIDIHKNNANAIKLLALLFKDCQNVAISHIKGGLARNAIARNAIATVVIDKKDKEEFLQIINQNYQNLKQLIGNYETNLTLNIATAELPNTSLSYLDSQKIINIINALPNGVIRQSDVIDCVETSLSVGKIALDNGVLTIKILIRSLNELGKQHVCTLLSSVGALGGLSVQFGGDYIGWTPNPQSPLTQLVQSVYANVLGKNAKLSVIHAGLECGLIQNAYPNMDIVSIGPTIKDAHSPDEALHIPSVATYWQVLTQIVANTPHKTS